jgi:hypothetical protein
LLGQEGIPFQRWDVPHRTQHLNDIIVGIEFLHPYDPSNL